MKRDESIYELYASRKNGRRNSDYPSLDSSQKVVTIGLKNFYLLKLECDKKLSHKISISTKSIQSDFGGSIRKKSEIHESKDFGCFCMR